MMGLLLFNFVFDLERVRHQASKDWVFLERFPAPPPETKQWPAM